MRTALRRRSVSNSALSQIHRGCKLERKRDHNKHGRQVAEIERIATSPAPTDRHRGRRRAQSRSPEALLVEKKSERRARSKARRKVSARDPASTASPAHVKSNSPARG